MPSDPDILLTMARVLAGVEVNDDDLARFDALTAYSRERDATLMAACQATGLALTHQVLMVVVVGMIVNWHDGGAEAALSLPDSETFDTTVAKDDAPHRELVKLVTRIIRLMAWAHIGDREKMHEAGKQLLDLAMYLLDMKKDQLELAISVSLVSRDVLERFGDPDAGRAQVLAYRMLVSPRQLPFLPDLPPMKFPPPIAPTFKKDALLDLCLQFIQQGVIDQPIDLAESAKEMRNDPEIAIKNIVQVGFDKEIRTIKFELAFGHKLIDWAFAEDIELGASIGANEKLRALLPIICENKLLLEAFRDDDFGYVYQMPYLGPDAPPKNRLDLCLKTEAIGDLIRCVVGLSLSEVRTNAARDMAFSVSRSTLLGHLHDCLEGDN